MSAEQHSFQSVAIRRILSELRELKKNPSHDFQAAPVDDNIFDWHFTIRGPSDTEFAGGKYHGRITLPDDYPFKPPSIILLTPNGRFEINKKICLTITGYHPEHWQPAWGIRTALMALISFLTTKAEGGIGGIDWTPEERKSLAVKSLAWKCKACGDVDMQTLLPDDIDTTNNSNNNGESCSTSLSPSPASPTNVMMPSANVDLSMFKMAYAMNTPTGDSSQQQSPLPDGLQSTPQTPVSDIQTQQVPVIRQRIDTGASTSTPSSAMATPTTPIPRRGSNHSRRLVYIDLLLIIIACTLLVLMIRQITLWLKL